MCFPIVSELLRFKFIVRLKHIDITISKKTPSFLMNERKQHKIIGTVSISLKAISSTSARMASNIVIN